MSAVSKRTIDPNASSCPASNNISHDDDTMAIIVRSTVSSSLTHDTDCGATTTLPSPFPSLLRRVSSSSSSYPAADGTGRGGGGRPSLSYTPRSSSMRYSSRHASSILQGMTVNKLQFDKLHCLYGRTKQVNELNRLVSKMNKYHERHLVLIQGNAGSGKLTLAMSVLPKCNKQGTLLAKGKFDVTLKDEPYSGIGEACRELVRNLLICVTGGEELQHRDNEERFDDDDSEAVATVKRRSSKIAAAAAAAAAASEIVGDLRTALGQDALLLYSLIPNLRLLLDGTTLNDTATNGDTTAEGTTPCSSSDCGHFPIGNTTKPASNANDGYNEATVRFQHTFRRFIRALLSCASFNNSNSGDDDDDKNDTRSSSRKLILILDDVHWADASSLELLEAILMDTENKTCNLLVIATFRSEQVSIELEQSLQRITSSLQGSSGMLFGLTTISLEDWQIPDLTAMLADLLNECRPETVLPLAECIHRKTRGNIFFSIQFLRALAETGKLTYQFGLGKWTWDDPIDILQQASSTANVIQLLTEKLKVLPNGIYKLLPAIACLGCQFRGFIVDFIVDQWDKKDESNGNKEEQPRQCSNDAKVIYNAEEIVNTLIDFGLIVEIGKDQYRWEHDKVQEAALSLVNPLELAELEYVVGDVLLDKLTKSQLEEMLFVVSDLIDQHPDPTKLPKKQQECICELNLDAGRKARESSAFQAASIYLRRGIHLLETDCWMTDYNLALDVYSAWAEANINSYCAGNVHEMKEDCNTIFENATLSFVDKHRAYDCLLYSTLALDAVQDTQDLCLELLA